MQVLVVFLISCFLIGGLPVGRLVRQRPILLLAYATVTAASFYSLSVVS